MTVETKAIDQVFEESNPVEGPLDANGVVIKVGDRVRNKDAKESRWGTVTKILSPESGDPRDLFWANIVASAPYLHDSYLMAKHVEGYDPAEDLVEREITDHRLGGGMCNDSIQVFTIGDLGIGGAHIEYKVKVEPNPFPETFILRFQNGDPHEVGVNGLTNEVLLAIVLDRLQEWQNTKNQCRENAIAITHLQEAQNWLARRSRLRECQGVEGQPNVPHVSP